MSLKVRGPLAQSIQENGHNYSGSTGNNSVLGVSQCFLITSSFSASLSLAIWPFSDFFPSLNLNHLSRMSH